MPAERRGLAAQSVGINKEAGRDDKGANQSAGPETKTIPQGEG